MLLVAMLENSFFLLLVEAEVEEDLDFLAEETVLRINALPVSCWTSDSFYGSYFMLGDNQQQQKRAAISPLQVIDPRVDRVQSLWSRCAVCHC